MAEEVKEVPKEEEEEKKEEVKEEEKKEDDEEDAVKKMMELDAEDESLRKWKEAILGSAAKGAPKTDDPRKIVIAYFGLTFPNKENEDILRELDNEEKVKQLKKEPLIVKEGVDCAFKVRFRVNHKIINGAQFVNKISKGPFNVKLKNFMGSYAPKEEMYDYQSETFTAPKGMLMRGKYNAKTTFVDNQGKTHLTIDYKFQVAKKFKK